MYCVRGIVKMIRNTHRHPANQALHCIGAPFYAIGAAMTLGHFAGMNTDPVAGMAMWIAAVAMFVSGHRIEGNAGSMTPVLLFRLFSKVARDFVAQQIHLLRA
jgi:predicted membrane channel-forming protein YqfA (hemolysin III family)